MISVNALEVLRLAQTAGPAAAAKVRLHALRQGLPAASFTIVRRRSGMVYLVRFLVKYPVRRSLSP
jgi:hypothetical protein